MSIEEMKQWLEALEHGLQYVVIHSANKYRMEYEQAITSLRQVIATEESSATQEPVGMTYGEVTDSMNALRNGTLVQQQLAKAMENKKLYTHPQPKAEQEPKLIGETKALWGGPIKLNFFKPIDQVAQPKRELTDAEIYKVIDQTENAVGYAHNAWDMADQIELVRAILKAAHEIINNYPDKDNSKREPLTDDELFDLIGRYPQVLHFARAIEAAHGIKGEA